MRILRQGKAVLRQSDQDFSQDLSKVRAEASTTEANDGNRLQVFLCLPS